MQRLVVTLLFATVAMGSVVFNYDFSKQGWDGLVFMEPFVPHPSSLQITRDSTGVKFFLPQVVDRGNNQGPIGHVQFLYTTNLSTPYVLGNGDTLEFSFSYVMHVHS